MANLGLTATWSPDDWANYVLDHLSTQAVLLNAGARRIVISGKSAKVPRLLTDGTTTWVAEGATIPSSAPTGDVVTLTPKKNANLVSLSNESIQDASVDSLNATGLAMTRATAKAIDSQLFSASAATATTPAGLLSLTLPTMALGALTLTRLITAVGTIEAAGGHANAIFVTAADLVALRLINDTTGRPLLEPDPTAPGAVAVAGARLYVAPLPAGKTLVAQTDQILVGIRRDITVDFSSDAGFSADSTLARVTVRVDAGVNDTNGLFLLST